MPVFVSHSRTTPEDEDALANVLAELKRHGIATWTDQGRLLVGLGLREQIRRGLRNCEVCLFVATPSSLASAWCLLEVGSFWGAGKPIVCFLANGATRTALPGGLGASLASGDLEKIASDLKKLLPTADSHRVTVADADFAFDLQVAQLRELVFNAVGLRDEDYRRTALGVTLMVRGLGTSDYRPALAVVRGSLPMLIGLPHSRIREHLDVLFPHSFTAVRSGQRWVGHGARLVGDSIHESLMFRLKDDEEIDGIAVCALVAAGAAVEITVLGEIARNWPGPDGWTVTPGLPPANDAA